MSEESQPDGERPSFFMVLTPFATAFVFAILLGVMVYIVPKFEQMFKEMEIGELPLPTRIVMAAGNVAIQFWYLLPGFLFVAVWMSKGLAKDRSKAFAWNMSLLLLLGVAVAFVGVALFMPMITIMEKVGK